VYIEPVPGNSSRHSPLPEMWRASLEARAAESFSFLETPFQQLFDRLYGEWIVERNFVLKVELLTRVVAFPKDRLYFGWPDAPTNVRPAPRILSDIADSPFESEACSPPWSSVCLKRIGPPLVGKEAGSLVQQIHRSLPPERSRLPVFKLDCTPAVSAKTASSRKRG